jgi:hypothetical protein
MSELPEADSLIATERTCTRGHVTRTEPCDYVVGYMSGSLYCPIGELFYGKFELGKPGHDPLRCGRPFSEGLEKK